MSFLKSSPRASFFILLVPALLASKCKDKDKNKDKELEDTAIEVAAPTITLQVASVDPNRVWIGEPSTAGVYGSGFVDGARVWVDASEVSVVSFRDENRLALQLPPLTAGAHDIRVRNPDGTSATLRSGLIVRAKPVADPTQGLSCDKITIAFEFNRSAITTESSAALQKHLPCFTTREGAIRVEGHCDERGTTDYNLSLGQRRAESIKTWLTTNGVSPSRIRAVSFGEERPLDGGHTEDSWARNRRVELFPAR